jgi:1,4-alpha-glucan branching enzyme
LTMYDRIFLSHLAMLFRHRVLFQIVETAHYSKPDGYFSLVLHAHLPYVRNPEHEYFLEERWFFEAISETYIPLLDLLGNLLGDGIDFRLTLSLTPTLIGMFNDGLLMKRYQRHLSGLIELAGKEAARTRRDAALGPVARMYQKKFIRTAHLFEDVYRKDLTAAFRALFDSGKVELIASAATHAYLPALMHDPESVSAQIYTGIRHFRKNFGRHPAGFWLPECGFFPGCETFLKDAGIRFFFLESHGLAASVPQNIRGIYAPIKTPSGVFAFSRDAECSRQVWSAQGGYPGDFDYRDFYRDVGFDLDLAYLKPYLPEGTRTFTGLKYFRITGKSDEKEPYVRKKALKRAKIHAEHFLKSRQDQVLFLKKKSKIQPIVTACYDAELFGHWWFEGPEWLGFFLRKAARQKKVKLVTPLEYLAENAELQTAMPSMSSWGDKGYSSTWVNSSNSWIYRHLSRAARMMKKIVEEHAGARGRMKRALNQAARELLLAQASDWAFMMKTGNAADFAEKKITGHIANFLALHREISAGKINETNLTRLELTNNVFPDIDYSIYARWKKSQLRSLSKG